MLCTGGKVGLLDFGQSKQLPEDARIAFAQLVHSMDVEDKHGIADAIKTLGIQLERDDLDMEARMAYGMFDTRGR